jgi:trans-aconitate methyltransferase
MTPTQIHVEPADHDTDLCILCRKHGSDKADRHDYTRYYAAIFRPIRERVTRVFELGIFGGSSLRLWREYFPNATIVGADIDPGMVSAARGERIVTIQCDETDKASVRELWDVERYDIMIDDALHTYEDNVRFFGWSRHMLRPGGIYIMEDLPQHELGYFKALMPKMREQGWACHLLDRSHRLVNGEAIPDNSLLVLRSPQ